MIRLKSLLEAHETGIMVTGSTQLDNNKIGDVIDGLGLHAEWNAREGYWMFPEKPHAYDALERLLEDEFAQHGINARFESI